MKVSVIIPAAGSGKRFGGKQNKIFERLGNRPVFIRTLELFVNRDDVCQVLLVVSGEDRQNMVERFGGNLGLMGVKIIDGGAQRADSVRNALAELDEQAELVAIHDAVRPCVSQLWIDDVFAAAEESGAAILAYPVHGTLKKVIVEQVHPTPAMTLLGEPVNKPKPKDVYRIDQTVDRDRLWQAQTPQVFRRDVIERAYAHADGTSTDDAQLVEAMGQAVSIVMGDPRNVKITTPRDLQMASAVINSLPKPKAKSDGNPFGEAQW